ncbi:hypothetical protein GCM10010435_53110 [Winogradskya consettensis]|uniref:DNA primase/polymerase bifunctional N-terminal domain-containing protein n=1 Tax=Winogradskya consettensis TaxID=113560 RepID=A0A919VQ99_9ACTN|nr:bifunctional DNA primase/polymerase [Actinoplanes consettensis]GIM71650.1 hypothetical protein Aco04nite_26330 [Actinoplanes consettensis]
MKVNYAPALSAALAYARHGIPVLPVHSPGPGGTCSCERPECDRPGKHPRLRHGLIDASIDPHRIEMWWLRWPDANVGLRTGFAMDVADVDSALGWHGLRHLLGGAMPPGPQVRTGGGWHFWFPPLGHGNRVRLLPGVDWRGAGGYVVAPPSRHASGATYHWVVRPNVELPATPTALEKLIAGPEPPSRGPLIHHRPPAQGDSAKVAERGTDVGRDNWKGDHDTDTAARRDGRRDREHRPGIDEAAGRLTIAHPDRYAAVAVAAETDRVARAPVGTRNDTLNRAAFALGRLVGAGLLDAATVVRDLTAAAAWSGLGRAETIRTIRSGLTAGRRTPLADRAPVVAPAIADGQHTRPPQIRADGRLTQPSQERPGPHGQQLRRASRERWGKHSESGQDRVA